MYWKLYLKLLNYYALTNQCFEFGCNLFVDEKWCRSFDLDKLKRTNNLTSGPYTMEEKRRLLFILLTNLYLVVKEIS